MTGHDAQGRRVCSFTSGSVTKRRAGAVPCGRRFSILLRDEGAAGATVLKRLAGFGAHSKIHTARLADLVPDLPVVVEWVDNAELGGAAAAQDKRTGRPRHDNPGNGGDRSLLPPRQRVGTRPAEAIRALTG
jgi:hypothetical protein